MEKNDQLAQEIDWSLTTWEGARREQTRRWAKLPLAQIISALEEMQVVADALAKSARTTGEWTD